MRVVRHARREASEPGPGRHGDGQPRARDCSRRAARGRRRQPRGRRGPRRRGPQGRVRRAGPVPPLAHDHDDRRSCATPRRARTGPPRARRRAGHARGGPRDGYGPDRARPVGALDARGPPDGARRGHVGPDRQARHRPASPAAGRGGPHRARPRPLDDPGPAAPRLAVGRRGARPARGDVGGLAVPQGCRTRRPARCLDDGHARVDRHHRVDRVVALGARARWRGRDRHAHDPDPLPRAERRDGHDDA